MGHIISKQGVAVDPTKIQVVLEWPTPTTVKGIHGFLGLAEYYRKFIRNFGGIAAPLHQLLIKDGLKWNEALEFAFKQLKEALASPLVLALLDFSQLFVIEYDASGIGIVAILSQNNRPISYFSEALKGSTLALSTYEKEMLAMVKSIQKWRHIYLGICSPFVQTRKASSTSWKQQITTPTQARWLPKINGYDYEIEYKKGVENQGADSLSRIVEFQFISISMPQADRWPML